MQVESVICQLLRVELGLPQNSVWIASDSRKIPPDDGMYVSVGMLSAQPISNNIRFDWDRNDNEQVVTLNGMFQVDVFSRDTSALERNWEVVAALQSYYASQLMEKYQFRIHEISGPIVNTSTVEGGSQMFRYSITIAVTWAEHKVSHVDYYTKFSISVGNEEKLDEWTVEWGSPKPPDN
jgi:hypothetical protein